jgi:diaminopimelate decarboxylase
MKPVINPVPGADYPQPDYTQADFSKLTSDGDEALREHFDRILEIVRVYAAPGRLLGGPSGALCALSRIDDIAGAARGLCRQMIGSYQKGE